MDDVITLDYGSGGKKTSALIENMILPALGNETLSALTDGAILPGAPELVFSTDSFVVNPCFFPGGDIGKLSVCGTVNLEKIIASIRDTAKAVGVQVVTGDTKVVERGKGDGIYINTSGIGVLRHRGLSPRRIRPGDRVLLSGTAGDHGAAVMLSRNAHLVEGELRSDCGSLHRLTRALAPLGDELRVMRDPTRGGVATTLCEFVEGTDKTIELWEDRIPVDLGVERACDILGLDPLYCACEGRLLAVVAPDRAEEALSLLRSLPEGENAAEIGRVSAQWPGKVVIQTPIGGTRIVAKLSGAQLPRIC